MRNLFALLILALLYPLIALPSIPKTHYIFKDLLEGKEKINSYAIEQTRTLYGKKYESGSLELKEEIYLVKPWRYARKSGYGDRVQITIYDGTDALVLLDKKWTVPESKTVIPFIYGFYLSREADDLKAFLSSKGINPQRTELSRINDLTAILFPGLDRKSYGFFADRDSFWPIAYRFRLGQSPLGGIEYLDIFFSNYKSIHSKTMFPMRYVRYERGSLTEQVVVTNVVINDKVPGNLFDIAGIKRRYERYSRGTDPEYFDLDHPVQ